MAKRIKTQILTYKVSLDNLANILSNIKDLTKLDKSVTLKFNNEYLLLYSLVGKGNNIHAFKSHKLKIKDTFKSIKNEIEEDIIYKIEDAKRFVTSMTVFVKYMKSQNIDDIIDFKIYFNEDYIGERLLIQNKKSKEETPGEKPDNNQIVDVDQIDEVMDIELSNYSFDLSKEDFNYIKSKTVIEKDNDILYLSIKDNSLSIGENRWDHNIVDIEYDDENITFPKKYFKCINYDVDNNMTIYVTDTFLMILGENTNLLVSIELSI